MEDSQGHIYVHHTVHATSESSDSMVVFDEKGKFVKSWGKEFKGGAHGLHIRKEGSTEYLYLCDTARGIVVKATLNGEEVFSIGYPGPVRSLQARRGRQEAEVQPDQPGDRAERRHLRRRRLRLQLHQPVQQQGRVHPHLRRQGQGSRASSIARTASSSIRAAATPVLTVADRAQQPHSALHARTASTSISSPAPTCPATSTTSRTAMS